MLNLSRESLKDAKAWAEVNIELPGFEYDRMAARTRENPTWVHFGAGNIFRGFIAALQQTLLNLGQADTGIIAVEAYDIEIIDRMYTPYDNLNLLVIMNPDGTLKKRVVGSIAEALIGDSARTQDWKRLTRIFAKPSLQMASFTITEKGYSLKKLSGEYLDDVLCDMRQGPAEPRHLMSKIASLAYTRYQSGRLPIAFVSMDNCSHNGEKLHDAVQAIVEQWVANGLVERDFLAYLNDPAQVTFPWSMIDKITPRPSETVKNALEAAGFVDTGIICTGKNTFIAPFVNAEGPQYLVIEDSFPNGRMPLELAGVIFSDRQTVDKVEKMKVCTCLNPLHTALAVFGCLLGYTLIADEMKDPHLHKLVQKIGYEEGLPVVINPGILNPADFLREVIEQRLPNPYIPDAPQRIATDTSQKIGIRFGETIKAYHSRKDLDPANLTYIPLVIAGWCRYLLGVDDHGLEMPLSPDPMLEPLRSHLSGVSLGSWEAVADVLQGAEVLKLILANESIFGINLYEAGLGAKIEGYFTEMLAGKNAVRATLQKYLG
ncbi:mannitol dehydrogenase family protein [Paradesulfitobacterium ferrireducens]|uniref:mannitol dehydrogenase family protein n=1 Tax=Paradesulfitobacterium ferrireducens TaxID=2816476 RepID=UPI002E2D50AB|nr:mannitol dehydrogenase family protein [Paradesulfitobacterium ferrireducens]